MLDGVWIPGSQTATIDPVCYASTMDDASIFLAKAEASLAGAKSELDHRRFDNCANRSYYACFQAAVAVLSNVGVQPGGRDGRWGHDFVQARFVGDLINRRKVLGGEHRDTLERLFIVRQIADYKGSQISETQAVRGLRRTRNLLADVRLAMR